MKTIIALSCAALLSLGATTAFADDDISREEAAKLVEQGKIKPLESLEEKALSVKPGTITDRDLELEYGRYTYKLDIRGDDGIGWDVAIDAVTAEILETKQDD